MFPQDQEFEDVNCGTMGVFAPLVGIVGSMQAAEALKLIIGIGESLAGRLLLLMHALWNGAASKSNAMPNVWCADSHTKSMPNG